MHAHREALTVDLIPVLQMGLHDAFTVGDLIDEMYNQAKPGEKEAA